MRRRSYLVAGVSMTAAMLAGCLGDDGDATDPEDVLDQLWTAWDDGDTDTFVALSHPDGPYRATIEEEIDAADGDEETPPQQADSWEIISRNVIEEADEEIIIEEIYRMDFPEEPEWEFTDRYTLRYHDGELLIWDIDSIDWEEV